MTDPLIGERWISPGRYIKHPPAASFVADGSPLDAGAEMLVRNNVAHLAEESLRHLVMETGPFPSKLTANGWANLSDGVEPAFATTRTQIADNQLISWDQRTAVGFGGFPLVADRTVTSGPAIGDRTIRKVRLRVEADVSNALARLLVALTLGDETNPGDMAEDATNPSGLYFNLPAGGTGVKIFTTDFDCTLGIGSLAHGMTTMPCRPPAPAVGSGGGVLYHPAVITGYLWIGMWQPSWFDLISVSAWEIL